MAITWTWGIADTSKPGFIVRKNTENLLPYGTARLAAKADIHPGATLNDTSFSDGNCDGMCIVEIRKGAYTDEELAEIEAKAVAVETNGKSSAVRALAEDDYGIKWRLWVGARPYPEQMYGTPWEEAVD